MRRPEEKDQDSRFEVCLLTVLNLDPAGKKAHKSTCSALPGVPEALAELISVNHYLCWCPTFLGIDVTCKTETNIVDVYQTTTVPGAKTIEDGTVTTTSTVVATSITVEGVGEQDLRCY